MNIVTIGLSVRAGASKRYAELLKGLLERGWNVDQFLHAYVGNELKHRRLKTHRLLLASAREAQRGRFHHFPGPLLRYTQLFFSILHVCKRKRVDVLYSFGLVDGFVCSLVKNFIDGPKVIVALRKDIIKGYHLLSKRTESFSTRIRLTIYIKILRFLEKTTLKTVDLIIFNSVSNKKAITQRAGFKESEKATVIYNNINPSWAEANKHKMVEEVDLLKNVANKKIVLGFVGNLYVEKGLLCLIRAFKLIRKELPKSILVIVGEGSDEVLLRKLVKKLGLQSSVIFTGWVENPYPYYNGFDLFIFPSINEGFANVILEALYYGTPVIASDDGPNVEALKYNDLLFRKENPRELADKVIETFKDVQRYETIKALCKKRTRTFEFDWRRKMTDPIITLATKTKTKRLSFSRNMS